MRMTEITYANQPPIDGYGPGFFRIGDVVHRGDVFVGQGGVALWDGKWESIDPASFDILLIGTGEDIAALDAETRAFLESRSIAFEVMATAPAARTYNVLLSEGRRVAVLLKSHPDLQTPPEAVKE